MAQGERVKQVRKSLGLTMENFGERLGITKTAISLIESGKKISPTQTSKRFVENSALTTYG